jgi:hypothetical protein
MARHSLHVYEMSKFCLAIIFPLYNISSSNLKAQRVEGVVFAYQLVMRSLQLFYWVKVLKVVYML